jgi:polyisoprenoid-binding protein YceI
MKRIALGLGLAVFLLTGARPAAAQSRYEFSAEGSKMEMDVYKEGFFKAFSHDHLIAAKEFSGRMVFDSGKIENSSVTFRVAAKSLTVVDPGESEKDRSAVQMTMRGKEVLDAEQFPEIAFVSTGIGKAEKKGDTWNLTLAGTLKLHGAEKPVSVPATLIPSGSELIARGEVYLLQTDYGITPIKLGGGAVKVKNRLRIRFEIHARAEAKP